MFRIVQKSNEYKRTVSVISSEPLSSIHNGILFKNLPHQVSITINYNNLIFFNFAFSAKLLAHFNCKTIIKK